MQIRWKYAWAVFAVCAVVVLYWPSLRNPLFFDDVSLLDPVALNNFVQRGFVLEPRWLSYFVVAWTDLVFDDRIFAQRSINVALHLLTGYVLYALIRQVSNHVAPHANNERAALAAALLFLLHPLAVYAVGYVVQRTIIMATLFGLLALNAYFDGLMTRKKAYFAFSFFFYALSVFSKEHAVLIPLVALAMTPLVVTMTRRTWRGFNLLVALFVFVVVFVGYKSRHIIGQAYEPFAAQMLAQGQLNESALGLWALSVMTQASLYFKYLLLTLIPYPGWMSIDMRVPFAAHLLQPIYLFGLLALTAYGVSAAALLLKGGRRGLVGFALLAPLLLFAVEFSAVRIQEPFVLYRTYLWIPLLFLLIPALTWAFSDKVFWLAVFSVALIFALASNDRLNSFSDKFLLWDDAIQKLPYEYAPGSARVYNNRGMQYKLKGDIKAAIADYSKSLHMDPTFGLAYWNRAVAYMKLGRSQEAIRDAKKYAELVPNDLDALVFMGVIYEGSGQADKARDFYKQGCVKESYKACIHLMRMNAKSTRGGSSVPNEK